MPCPKLTTLAVLLPVPQDHPAHLLPPAGKPQLFMLSRTVADATNASRIAQSLVSIFDPIHPL